MQEQPGGREEAPGRLALVQAFVNTLDREGGEEMLQTPEHLGRWLRERRLLEPGERIDDPGDLVRARALRESLRAALWHERRPLDGEARAVIEREAERAGLSLAVDSAGVLVLVPRAAGLGGALGRLLAIVVEAQAEGHWSRLRVCVNDVCQWAYYDASRNRSGRWCSMAVCGNRTKVRAHRTRTAPVPGR